MKVLVLGCGYIGSVLAEDLAGSAGPAEVVVADRDGTKARNLAEGINTGNISWLQLDAANRRQLSDAVKDFNLIVGLLPAELGYGLVETCIDAGIDLVDVSYMAENPMGLNDKAEQAEVTIVPDCGLSPGIGNILVGRAVAQFDKTIAVHLMVGGFPERPVPPLDYTITWSVENLIDEYTRKARIVREGRKVEVEALSGLEKILFPNIGTLEAFYTDGLRTLLDTVTGVRDMWEKTLRYPGHTEKIRLLSDLGLLDEGRIEIEGATVSPRKFTSALLKKKLSRPEIGDIVALKVEVSGVKGGKEKTLIYHMIDRYDAKRGITAMARTTAYPASIITQMILNSAITEKGVIPPEKIGMDNGLFRQFLKGLAKRGITFIENENAGLEH